MLQHYGWLEIWYTQIFRLVTCLMVLGWPLHLRLSLYNGAWGMWFLQALPGPPPRQMLPPGPPGPPQMPSTVVGMPPGPPKEAAYQGMQVPPGPPSGQNLSQAESFPMPPGPPMRPDAADTQAKQDFEVRGHPQSGVVGQRSDVGSQAQPPLPGRTLSSDSCADSLACCIRADCVENRIVLNVSKQYVCGSWIQIDFSAPAMCLQSGAMILPVCQSTGDSKAYND